MAFRRKLKNFVKQYSDVEVKVREATSNDPWGPSGSLMMEIAGMTYYADSLSEIMRIIWHRMNDSGKNWRHVYKSLTLLDYLIKNGSRQVIVHCIERAYNIQLLKDFKHIDNDGKDQGIYVRQKSTKIIELLVDAEKLKSEREKACILKKQMFLSTLRTVYKARPTVNAVVSLIEAKQVPKVEVNAAATKSSSQHIPVQMNMKEPVQDLLLLNEDKSQLLHTSFTYQDPGAESKYFMPEYEIHREIKRPSKNHYTLLPPPKPAQENIVTADDKKLSSNKSSQTKLTSWAEELKKLPYQALSNSVSAAFNSPWSIPFQRLENSSSARSPYTYQSGTLLPSQTIATSTMDPRETEQIDIASVTSESVPESQKSLISQKPISTDFPFQSSQKDGKLHRNDPTSLTPELSTILSEETALTRRHSDPFSSLQYGPYSSTDPFLNPVMPTSSTFAAPFTAVLPTASHQDNVHLPEPSTSYSGLRPSTSFISTQVTNPSSFISTEVTNPIQSSLTRRVSFMVAQDLNVPNPPDPFLLFPPQSHTTNPFL
ncbi:ENTH domain-containing protein 1 isoform X2 [Pseudophryne corroboree]|uniref:ENTH domain-containing protein 1 isoform X2 n=1 Tax=Pseudophryne corroboree TaxID=495146 RepID=UPI0030817600